MVEGLWLRVFHHPSSIIRHPSTIVHRPSTINHRPSALSLGVLGEPASAYSFALLKQFFDAPERGEGKNAEQDREQRAFDKQRADYSEYTSHEKYPPTLDSEVVLGFDDYRVKHTNGEKCCGADDKSVDIHSSVFL